MLDGWWRIRETLVLSQGAAVIYNISSPHTRLHLFFLDFQSRNNSSTYFSYTCKFLIKSSSLGGSLIVLAASLVISVFLNLLLFQLFYRLSVVICFVLTCIVISSAFFLYLSQF